MISLVTLSDSTVERIDRAQGPSVIASAAGDSGRDFDAEVYATHGIVSRPSTKTRGVRFTIGHLSIILAAYTYGVEPPANPGACKVYSTDADGAEQGSHLLDNDGTHTFNGGTDFAVRFSALETAFNELKGKYNALVTAHNTHVHPGVTTGSGSTGATATIGTASAANISGAKVEEIKIP